MTTDNFKTTLLGATGLKVGRLGLAASYGAPAEAFEEAFEKGCNYFYIGSGRHRSGMKTAIKNLCQKGLRQKMVVSIQTYARLGMMTRFFFKKSLGSLGIDYADVVILGWHNSIPPDMLLNFALKLKQEGLCRFIGISGHNRSLFPLMAERNIFDIFHIRYNPAHRGAQTECFSLHEPGQNPGIVSYTATRWGHLLDQKKMPPKEEALTAPDCYRFVLSNPHVDICMCGPKDIQQMQTALTSLDAGPLETPEMDRIKKIGDHVHKTAKGFF